MKKLLHFFELLRLLVVLPFEVSDGKKKHTYKKIKQILISIKLI